MSATATKARTPKISNTRAETSQKVAWLKAAQGIEKNVGKLLDQLDGIKELTVEGLEKIENERLAAQTTLDAQLLEMDGTRQRKLLELELELERKEREGAIEILKKSREVPIEVAVKEQLEAETAQLKQSNAEAIKAAESAVRKSMAMTHQMELERLKLTNAKDMAELTQKNLALEERISEKNAIIQQKVEESVRLQKLVQSVAEASQPTIQMPSASK